jgi:hypothetical protein
VLASLVLVPAAEAQRPRVETGAATDVTDVGATLRGSVWPNGRPTGYVFEYGQTRNYGTRTRDRNAGSGNTRIRVSATIGSLRPRTTYHYRLVAIADGNRVEGRDRTFTTTRPRNNLSIAFSRAPVRFGSGVRTTGTLSGPGAAGAQVVLQEDPYPFGDGFAQRGAAVTAAGNGSFSFVVSPMLVNTRFRAFVPGARPRQIVSPVRQLGVRYRTSIRLSGTRPRRGRRVRFTGFVSPARDGTPVRVKRLVGNRWVSVGRTRLRPSSSTRSRYGRSVRVFRSGRYRVEVLTTDPARLPGISGTRRIFVR